jgi:hypothetical protein
MELMSRQVRNYYSQKNQVARLVRALAFKKAANFCCPSNVWLPIFFHQAWRIQLSIIIVPNLIIEAG